MAQGRARWARSTDDQSVNMHQHVQSVHVDPLAALPEAMEAAATAVNLLLIFTGSQPLTATAPLSIIPLIALCLIMKCLRAP